MFFSDFGEMRQPAVDNTSLYKTLNVNKNASISEIKQSFHKLARKHHPDKGGDEKVFQEITRAHDILSDTNKRAQYDQFGIEGVEQSGNSRMPSSMFRNNRRNAQQRGKSIDKTIKVSLENIYNGGCRKLRIKRKVIDKNIPINSCNVCKGQGITVNVVRMGPMVQHIQQPCSKCHGNGTFVTYKQSDEIIEFHVPKGAPDGYKQTFYEKADESPNIETGDLNIIIKEEPHPIFKRRGFDLYVEKDITLTEALCGYCIHIKHLDGRMLVIRNQAVTSPILFDPFDTNQVKWDLHSNQSCSLIPYAEGDISDAEQCKHACEHGQLKNKNITGFAIHNGKTKFYNITPGEILKNKQKCPESNLYVLHTPPKRLIQAIKGDGLPVFRNQSICGNLFLLLTIKFPTKIDKNTRKALLQLLPNTNEPPIDTNLDQTECDVELLDPEESFNEHETSWNDATRDDDDNNQHGGNEQMQCAQQ